MTRDGEFIWLTFCSVNKKKKKSLQQSNKQKPIKLEILGSTQKLSVCVSDEKFGLENFCPFSAYFYCWFFYVSAVSNSWTTCDAMTASFPTLWSGSDHAFSLLWLSVQQPAELGHAARPICWDRLETWHWGLPGPHSRGLADTKGSTALPHQPTYSDTVPELHIWFTD